MWLNIGGIANITVVPRRGAPGRTLWPSIPVPAILLSTESSASAPGPPEVRQGRQDWARGARGRRPLREMLSYRYFRRKPPKSTGPEEFGEAFLRRYKLPKSTRRCLRDARGPHGRHDSRRHRPRLRRVRPSRESSPPAAASTIGPSCHASRAGLDDRYGYVTIVDTSAIGIHPDASEAFAFAVLGLCTLAGIPNNLPSATGAFRAAVLGKIAYPE